MRRWVNRVLALAALVACTDMPNEPRSAAAPIRPAAARGGTQGGNDKSSLDLIEDDVASGALDKQNANIYREAALSDPSKLPSKYRSSAKGKDATLHPSERRRRSSTSTTRTCRRTTAQRIRRT